MKKDIKILIAMLVLFLLIGGGLIYADAHGLLPKAPPTPTTGSLILSGVPEGAEIRIDGKVEAGGTKYDLLPGQHNVYVSAPGYYDRRFVLVVEPGKTLERQVSLEEVASKSANPLLLVFWLVAFVLVLFVGMFMGMSGRQRSYK